MNDDFNTAIHESGHAVCATHFKIPAFPEITPGGHSRITGLVFPEHAGACHFDDGLITPFQRAVISWAGTMAEASYANQQFWMPPFPPSVKMLRDWHGAMMQQIKRLSDGDRLGIIGYRDTWRSCKSAFAIVRKNRARIVRLAKAMTGGREKKSVPMPEKFPAPFAEFLRLIVGTDKPEEKFRAFVRGTVEKFFAEKNLPLEPDQQKEGIECWTGKWLEKYQAGFDKAELWRNAALAYRDWKKRIQTP